MEFERVDIKQEFHTLSVQDMEKMTRTLKDLDIIWTLEEIKAKQISRDRIIMKEGDMNTTYFQAEANQSNRKRGFHF